MRQYVLVSLALLLCACSAPPKTQPTKRSHKLAEIADSCCPPSEEEWTEVKCLEGHVCLRRGKKTHSTCPRCAFMVKDLTHRETPEGDLVVTGTLIRKPGHGNLLPRKVVALIDARAQPGSKRPPVREVGRIDLFPNKADPVPQYENFRVPFRLNLSREGLPLLRGRDGKRRLSLFGLVTSEEGPAFVGLIKLSF